MSPEISNPRPTLKCSQKPGAISLRRGCGQWGLLGGSSSPDKGNVKTKPSKLASLARSSKGAFDKRSPRQQYDHSSRLASVSRLAALNSGSKSEQPLTPTPYVPQSGRPSDSSNDDTNADVPDSINVNALTDPHADHLLAQPSILANCLFQLWVVPQDVTNSLLRIYANPYLLTVSNETQLQKAFSTASPDDIVRNARLPSKGMLTLIWLLISGGVPPRPVDAQQPKIETSSLEIKSVGLDDENGAQMSLKTKRKTLEDIKIEIMRQEKSAVSFVIIGRLS